MNVEYADEILVDRNRGVRRNEANICDIYMMKSDLKSSFTESLGDGDAAANHRRATASSPCPVP
jgi:hypothetical protein